MVFWENYEAGLRMVANDKMYGQLGVIRLKGREERDSEDGSLNGLDKRDDEYAGVADVRIALGDRWRHWAGMRLEGGGRDAGSLGSLSYGFHSARFGGGMGTEAIFSVSFADNRHINRHFGVTERESARAGNIMVPDPANPGQLIAGPARLPVKKLRGGYRSVGLKIIHRRDISRNWHLIVEGGAEVYGRGISDSPIARESRDFNGGATVLYQF